MKRYIAMGMMLLAIGVMTGCEGNSHEDEHIKQEDYANSQWLGFHGSVPKGYQPFLEVRYRTYLDECRIQKDTGIFDQAFVYILTRLIPVEGGFYPPQVRTKIYRANLTKNKKNYNITYPNNFEINGCRFDIDYVWFKINSSPYKTKDNQSAKGIVFRYYFTNRDYQSREHNITGNYYCKEYFYQTSEKYESKKSIECLKEGEKYQSDYILIRRLYSINELFKEKNITVNIFTNHSDKD